MDARHEVKSLKKALRILSFMNQRGDVTVSDVARAIGVPRPTSYRLLETLASEGYVEKQEHSVFYRLTSMVQRLAAGFQDEELLLEIAKPRIQELGRELGWPITFSTPKDRNMVVRLNTDHDCALALERWSIGFSVPMLLATGGYCYLANCTDSERDRVLENPALHDRFAPNVLEPGESRYLSVIDGVGYLARFDRTRRDDLKAIVDQTREHGFCNIEHKQYREGNVAVPVLLDGRFIGAIVMRYIKSVLKNSDRVKSFYVPKLQQLADEIVATYHAGERLGETQAVPSPRAAQHTADVFYPKFG